MSEMVSTATGRPLNEYAEELLFGPIGIKDYVWKDAPKGFKDAAGGMYLKPRNQARFALLYEREGDWDGKQILPAQWSQGHRPFCRSLSVQRFEERGVTLVNVVVKVDQSLIINLSRPVEDKNGQRL